MSKGITRSTVNSEQYAAPEHSKSGFDLSYSRHSSMMLGRLHIGGFQYCMPGDKISGGSKFDGTFNRLVTPMVTPMRIMSYNIFLPFRAVDTSFIKGMTPTKYNSMSANWSVPTVSTRALVSALLNILNIGIGDSPTVDDDPVYSIVTIEDFIKLIAAVNVSENLTGTLQDFATDRGISDLNEYLYGDGSSWFGLIGGIINSLSNDLHIGGVYSMHSLAKRIYVDDVLQDIVDSITAKLGSLENPISASTGISEFLYNYIDCIFSPFIGRNSYFGELKYNYLRPSDIYRFIYQYDTLGTVDNFVNLFDSTGLSEYPIRIMYSIWYELFRNVDLEPVGSDVPDWREFGSSSIDRGLFLCMCLIRPRSWEKDMFTTAQIDDISRHVYAPILDYNLEIKYHTDLQNNLDVQNYRVQGGDNGGMQNPSVYNIGYLNSDGSSVSLNVPVPTNVNDILSSTDLNDVQVYGLDLNSLRQSQMLERYLKRNYLFGDEYQDRLLAHYNSRLSDMRINRPEIVGRAINDYEMSQEVSNVSTEYTKVGDRTATAKLEVQGDNYTTYCEEFGMLFTIYSIMPRPQYDGVAPQLLLNKQVDFPLPEFASNNEEFGRKMEIASSAFDPNLVGTDGSDARFMFGRYPAYHAWRSRIDEVGGLFLNELQDCTFRRFFGLISDESTPKLNYYFIHCRPNLNMFANTIMLDYQVYGDFIHECYVERVLPTPVEVI